MAQMDDTIRKQLEKPQTWFCKYFPKRIRNVGEKEIADRQMVYDFKDGRAFETVAQMTASSMVRSMEILVGTSCLFLFRHQQVRNTNFDTKPSVKGCANFLELSTAMTM